MRKILFLLLIVGFCAGKTHNLNLRFSEFKNDEFFVFAGSNGTVTCEFEGIKIINFAMKPKCMRRQSDIRNYYIEHKKSVEERLIVGKEYLILINDAKFRDIGGERIYMCRGFYGDKKDNDIQRKLLRYGWALPANNKNSLYNRFHRHAKESKRGMYSFHFKELKNCLLHDIPMKSQPPEFERDEFYEYR